MVEISIGKWYKLQAVNINLCSSLKSLYLYEENFMQCMNTVNGIKNKMY